MNNDIILKVNVVGIKIGYKDYHFKSLEDYKTFIKKELTTREINKLGNSGYLEVDHGSTSRIYRLDDLSARAWSSSWTKTKEAIEASK